MKLFIEVKEIVNDYVGIIRKEKKTMKEIAGNDMYSETYYLESRKKSDEKLERARNKAKELIRELAAKRFQELKKQEKASFKISDIEIQNELTTLSLMKDTITREQLQEFYNRLYLEPKLSMVIQSIAGQRGFVLLEVPSLIDKEIEDYNEEYRTFNIFNAYGDETTQVLDLFVLVPLSQSSE